MSCSPSYGWSFRTNICLIGFVYACVIYTGTMATYLIITQLTPLGARGGAWVSLWWPKTKTKQTNKKKSQRKAGKIGKKMEDSFTLPLLTWSVDYAAALVNYYKMSLSILWHLFVLGRPGRVRPLGESTHHVFLCHVNVGKVSKWCHRVAYVIPNLPRTCHKRIE